VRRFGIGRLDRPLAAIFLTDPNRVPETPVETLQRLFALTLGEAEVLRLLTTGQTVEEIAATLAIRPSTVRSHLASLFAKTDTRRQAELIQKVLTSPAWLAGRDGP
jgi:DNA-binding CsgD family transcriptional regulator